MALALQLWVTLLIATATCQSLKQERTQPTLVTILQYPQTISGPPPPLALTLQVPKTDLPQIPFYSNYERGGPQNSDYPVPSQELQVPAAEPWNPENDPKFYYELPPALTKQEIPTNLYPKKYNKEIHEKQKPFSYKPKQEIELVPISEKGYSEKQTSIDKTLSNLAKNQNQKQVVKLSVKEPQTAASHFLDSEIASSTSSSDGKSRMEFHMRGHDGPSSYKWGYDTGNGQFRYEERDKEGLIKGHYGYHDKHGKLRMVHYKAHPHEGFHAQDSD